MGSTVGGPSVKEYISCWVLLPALAIHDTMSVFVISVPYPTARYEVWVTLARYCIWFVSGKYEIDSVLPSLAVPTQACVAPEPSINLSLLLFWKNTGSYSAKLFRRGKSEMSGKTLESKLWTALYILKKILKKDRLVSSRTSGPKWVLWITYH